MPDADPASPLEILAREIVIGLGLHDETGHPAQGAYDEVARLLRHFVTESGSLPREVRGTLGPSGFGRTRLLRHILRAFVGPEPELAAWRSALAAGGFKLIDFDAIRRAAGEDRKQAGSPGLALPRALEKVHSRATRPVIPARRGWLLTSTAVNTAVAFGLMIQRACCAGIALGASLVLSKAADGLSSAELRQLDAHTFDEAFIAALRNAISEVISRFPAPTAMERSNRQVATSIRGGNATLEQYFASREKRLVASAAQRILQALTSPGTRSSLDKENTIYLDIADNLRSAAAGDQAGGEVWKAVGVETEYLYRSRVEADESDEHHTHLRNVMGNLVRPRDSVELYMLERIANDEVADCGPNASILTRARQEIAVAIRTYVEQKGPPPVDVPVQHIPIFERQALALAKTKKAGWHNGQKWVDAGLIGHQQLEWMFSVQ